MGKYTPQPPPPSPPSRKGRQFLWLPGRRSLFKWDLLLNSQDHKTRKVWYFRTALSVSTILPQNSRNTAHIFLTSRNHVKIFLSGYFHNVSNVVYRTTLSIRTERTDKTVSPWSDCPLRSSLIRVFTICHSICFIYTWYCKETSIC